MSVLSAEIDAYVELERKGKNLKRKGGGECQRASTDKRPAFSLVRVEGEGGVLCPALWAMRRTEDDCAKAGDAKNSHRTDHPVRESLTSSRPLPPGSRHTHAPRAGSKMYKQLCSLIFPTNAAREPSERSGGGLGDLTLIRYLLSEFEG